MLIIALAGINAYLFYPEESKWAARQVAAAVKVLFDPMDYERLDRAEFVPSVVPPAEVTETETDFVPVNNIVAIDPGHGGKDHGAVSEDRTLYENEINLSLAKKIAAILEENGVQVIITCENDNMTLEKRVEKAREAGAGLFVSVHHNANYSDHSGCEIYVSGRQNEWAESSRALAVLMMKKLTNAGVTKRGVFFRLSQAGSTDSSGQPNDYYGVIRLSQDAGMSALLTETAFLNDADRQFLSGEKQDAVAKAYAEAILEFLGLAEPEESGTAADKGDVNGDGKVDVEDVRKIKNALLCLPDAPVGRAYEAADVNSNGLADAFDIYAVNKLSLGGELPEMRPAGERISCGISSDAELFRKGRIVTVAVTVGGGRSIASAEGSVDYNTECFEFLGTDDEVEGLTLVEDDKFGLVRYQFLTGSENDGLGFSLRFRMTGSPTGDSVSMNLNCYSAVWLNDGEVCLAEPACVQTRISLSA